ncbi:hypothetical protein [Natronosalvus vescus]|uniref:hypothetical protein n=1 Tax=Natronosalvus vescus TaxID=2953881 RepID=UPI0020912B96|nr:hypothetical protein [Natronosalvus vescus]
MNTDTSRARTADELGHLSDRALVGATNLLRAIERDAPDERVSDLARELWEITDAADDLLETVNLGQLADSVHTDALSDLVKIDGIPRAIRDRDADAAFDLRDIRRAVELRELWNAVDLLEFRTASRRLAAEIEDVIGTDRLSGAVDSDSEAAADLEAFGDEIQAEAPNVALQQQAKKRMKLARRGVLEGHAALEEMYAENRRSPTAGSRRGLPRNPTAVSLHPTGPLPDSASTRYSSVPPVVRGAEIDPLPRVYGRRWAKMRGSS